MISICVRFVVYVKVSLSKSSLKQCHRLILNQIINLSASMGPNVIKKAKLIATRSFYIYTRCCFVVNIPCVFLHVTCLQLMYYIVYWCNLNVFIFQFSHGSVQKKQKKTPLKRLASFQTTIVSESQTDLSKYFDIGSLKLFSFTSYSIC